MSNRAARNRTPVWSVVPVAPGAAAVVDVLGAVRPLDLQLSDYRDRWRREIEERESIR